MIARLCWTVAVALLVSPVGADEPARKSPVAPALKRMEWKVGEVTREALVAAPAETAKAPVVFVWHGHGGTMNHAARTMAIHTRWPEAIVVYPQGLPTSGRLTDPEGKRPGWQHNPGEMDDRDLRFFDAMLATALGDLRADPARVYASGHSNGGRFVYLLWATRGDRFAAFAPSASPAIGLLPRMAPKPCLHIAGETDKLVPFASQKATIDRVRALNHCEADGQPWPEFKGTVRFYASPEKTSVVTAIYPGGHEFPGEAPDLIVRFFRQVESKGVQVQP